MNDISCDLEARRGSRRGWVELRGTGRALGRRAGDTARIAGRASSYYVRHSPWRAIGIVALVSVAVAYVIGRR